MRICIALGSPWKAVERALEAIIGLNPSFQIVGQEEADVIIVGDARQALGFLKDDEDVKVLAILLGGNEERVGAESLSRAFPDRVIIRPALERDGEENIVQYLINYKEEV